VVLLAVLELFILLILFRHFLNAEAIVGASYHFLRLLLWGEWLLGH